MGGNVEDGGGRTSAYVLVSQVLGWPVVLVLLALGVALIVGSGSDTLGASATLIGMALAAALVAVRRHDPWSAGRGSGRGSGRTQ